MPKYVFALVAVFAGCVALRLDTDDGDERGEHEHPNGIYQRSQARSGGPGAAIPHDALMLAWTQKEQMAALDDLGAPVQWTWLGPGNIGGRLRAVVIDPGNPQRMWLGSAGGGVWYSDTGGASWQPRNGLLTMLGCGCMALDPANSNHLYFGSGEGTFDAVEGTSNTAILRGAGVFESFDAGVSWTRLASTATPDWYFVNRIAFAPGNPQVMLAATGSGIWRSTNGGQSWSQRTTTRTLDIDFHPTDATQALAGRADGFAMRTLDGGVTWAPVQIGAISTRIELAYARSSPSTVFATVSDTSWFIHVWRSLDGGATWTQRSTASIGTYSLYNNALWVDPTNANNVVYGGVQLYRSTDAGATRVQFTTGSHPDYHVIVEQPGYNGTTNKRIYTGDDGGLHTITDWQTGGWTALNNGLGVTQFYGAAMSPAGVMVAGAQDNGTNRYNGNPAAWTYNVIGGDGGFCAADPNDANYLYGEYQHLGIARSSNAGVSWTDIRGATTTDIGFNFIPYFLLDPNNSNRMWACGRSLWRTDNVKTGAPPTWVQVKAPRNCPTLAPIPNDHFAENPFCNHSAAAIAVGNPDVVWVAHNDGELHRTANGTAAAPTWTLVDSAAGGQLPDRWISSIAIDPSNHQRVLVSCMGYTTGNVWETLDNGVTWHTIDGIGAGQLPALPVSWIAMHPVLHDLLFAATDLGLFHSTNGGASWSPVADGPENVCIEQLVWKNPRELLCVTHGRGVYVATLPLAGATTVGTGCAAGAAPAFSATAPVVGTTMQFQLANARTNALVVFAINFGAPLAGTIGACSLHVDLSVAAVTVEGLTSAAGAWSKPLAIPPMSVFVGQQLTAQALIIGNGGPLLGLGDLTTGLQVFLGL